MRPLLLDLNVVRLRWLHGFLENSGPVPSWGHRSTSDNAPDNMLAQGVLLPHVVAEMVKRLGTPRLHGLGRLVPSKDSKGVPFQEGNPRLGSGKVSWSQENSEEIGFGNPAAGIK